MKKKKKMWGKNAHTQTLIRGLECFFLVLALPSKKIKTKKQATLFGCPPCLKTKTTNEKAPKKNKKIKKSFAGCLWCSHHNSFLNFFILFSKKKFKNELCWPLRLDRHCGTCNIYIYKFYIYIQIS